MKLPEPPPRAKAVAATLVERHGVGVAFLMFGDAVWFAYTPPGAPPWRRPTLDLVQGVYGIAGRWAHRVLRSRIYLPATESRLDRAVVQVAARRMTSSVEVLGSEAGGTWIDVGPAARRARRAARSVVAPVGVRGGDDVRLLQVAQRMAVAGPTTLPRVRQARRVGAVLSVSDSIVAGARNKNGVQRCAHAELRLVQGWTEHHGAPLPAGARIAVSLQCCRMCAAMVVAGSQGPIDVVFGAWDTGRLAQGTVLQELGWERHVDLAEASDQARAVSQVCSSSAPPISSPSMKT